MSLPELIYDRTEQDVQNAAERAVIAYPTLGGDYHTTDGPYPILNFLQKAFWNAVDLNRIELWTAYHVKLLERYGYTVKEYIPRSKEWDMHDIPFRVQVDRIRSNIDALRHTFFAIPTWREILYNNSVDFHQANTLEWDLKQVSEWLESMIAGFEMRQAGTLFMIAGGVFHA